MNGSTLLLAGQSTQKSIIKSEFISIGWADDRPRPSNSQFYCFPVLKFLSFAPESDAAAF